MAKQDYTNETINVLSGLEAVRKRPGMYIGDTDDGSGMHHMLLEIVGNAVDEHRRGFASYVRVAFDGRRVSVEDDGRGIPIEPCCDDGRSELEIVMTVLHGGGRWRREHVHLVSSLHGVGAPVVCALSSRLDVEVWRDGSAYVQSFERGVAIGPVQRIGLATRTGTRVSFTPDPTIVKPLPWDVEKIARCGRELAALNPRLTVIVEHDAYRCPEGLADRVRYLARDAELTELLPLHGARNGIVVEAAIAWTDRDATQVHGYVNCAPTTSNGTHVVGLFDGMRRGLAKRTQALRRVRTPGFRKRIEPGIVACVHVTLDNPRWGNPSKEWLTNPEVGEVVSACVADAIAAQAHDNPALLDSLLLRLGA